MREHRGVPPAAAVPRSAVPEQSRPALLALRALGLGDFVTSVPALRALQRTFPNHRRVLAGPEAYRELLALAGLDWEAVTVDGPRTPPWPHRRSPELAVNLHGRGPQSVRALNALGPRRLWTYHPADPARQDGPSWRDGAHDVDLWCDLLAHHDVRVDPGDLRWPVPDTSRVPDRTAVVHPGASSGSRRWPELRFAELARGLRDRGLRVVVTGSERERRLAERVARVAGLDSRAVLAGRTSLPRLAEIVAGARLMVCGDTGVAHLATAYGTPSVLLFGPSSPTVWGPRLDPGRHLCLWSGRTGDPHAERLHPGLASITARAALAACDDLLADQPTLR